MIEFDTDERAGQRILAKADPKTAPALQLIAEGLRRLTTLLQAVLAREPVVQVVTPPPVLPPAQVALSVPPRPCRTVVVTIERDRDGRARTMTFTEKE